MTTFDMTGTGQGDRMERNSGGGWLMVFGLPFLAAGLFMMLTALGLSGVPMDEDIPALFLFILGLVFSGAGAGRCSVAQEFGADSATLSISGGGLI
jgi:hypothetical protein